MNEKISALKAQLKKEFNVPEVMLDRRKLETDEILGHDLTIENFDLCNFVDPDTKVPFAAPVLNFEEHPGCYYRGGQSLKKFVETIVNAYDGDIDTAVSEFSAEKIRIRLVKLRTRSGNDFYNVQVLD